MMYIEKCNYLYQRFSHYDVKHYKGLSHGTTHLYIVHFFFLAAEEKRIAANNRDGGIYF